MRTKISKSRLFITGLILLSLFTATCNPPGGKTFGTVLPSGPILLEFLGVLQ